MQLGMILLIQVFMVKNTVSEIFSTLFIIADDESEMGKKPKLGSQVVDQLLVKAENDDNLYMSLKNLLFISEYSDEEKSD